MVQCLEGPGVRGEWAHSQVRAISAPSRPESQLPFGPGVYPQHPCRLPCLWDAPAGQQERRGAAIPGQGRAPGLGLGQGLTWRALSEAFRDRGPEQRAGSCSGPGVGTRSAPRKGISLQGLPSFPPHLYSGRGSRLWLSSPVEGRIREDRGDFASPASRLSKKTEGL